MVKTLQNLKFFFNLFSALPVSAYFFFVQNLHCAVHLSFSIDGLVHDTKATCTKDFDPFVVFMDIIDSLNTAELLKIQYFSLMDDCLAPH